MTWNDLKALGTYPCMPILIGPDVSRQLDAVMAEMGLTGRGVAVYDDLSYQQLPVKPTVFRSILFDSEQLYCEEESLRYLERQCKEEHYLLAVGGEAIQSIVKLTAEALKLPYLAVPVCAYGIDLATANADYASAQGWERRRGASPSAIIADTTLMAQAKEGMTLGAVRALIDRTEALARGRAVALASGCTWNQSLDNCQQAAIDAALRACNHDLRRGKSEAYALLCEALITCGLAEEGMTLPTFYPTQLTFLRER